VADHPIFQRDGSNLFCRVPVSMAEAALGGEIEVPTIDGGRKPGEGAGRQPVGQADAPARQGDAGAPRRRLGRHVHRTAVETPVNLTARQKELLREFDRLSEENNPESKELLLEGEELLGRDEGLTSRPPATDIAGGAPWS
jgi:molecular chaperone DnaJ